MAVVPLGRPVWGSTGWPPSAVLIFQLVVEEHGVFPESGLGRMVDVGEQAAVHGLARHRVVPGGARCLHDDGPEQAVDVGSVLATAGVRHVGKQEDALLIRLPGIADAAADGRVRIEAHIGAVGGQHVVGKALHVDGRPATQLVFEVNLNGVAHVGTDDQGPNLLIRLGDGKCKPLACLPLDALGILLSIHCTGPGRSRELCNLSYVLSNKLVFSTQWDRTETGAQRSILV